MRVVLDVNVWISGLLWDGMRDPEDVKILATAIAANAEVIVTGDRDLLALQEFQSIPILTPTDFLTRYFPTEG